MQFFIYFSLKENESMCLPKPEKMKQMGELMEESFKSGIIVSTGQLPQLTTHIELENGNFSITDGPFTEGKEIIPGFTIINVNSKKEALDWSKKLRVCMGDGVIKMAQLSATSADDMKI